jgi:ubiquinone/menaquinone biosynthesis C-methylase UbiE
MSLSAVATPGDASLQLPFASTSTPRLSPGRRLLLRARAARYTLERLSVMVASGLFMRGLHQLMLPTRSAPPREQVRALEARIRELLRADLRNAAAGVYPPRLLFESRPRELLSVLPSMLVDLPRVVRRARRRGHDELPAEAGAEHYPRYYQRNFHWQTDGWLSDGSARRYEPSVELLFGGTANVMRRMGLPPLLEARSPLGGSPRVLDVACGTGAFLSQLAAASPRSRLYGIDLSPYYLRHAREQTLAHLPNVDLVADNAEAMPYADGYFDAASCVFLFHELPKDVRRRVMAEVHRTLRPGATFVVVDAAQYSESGEVRWFLDQFPRTYHEPYFKCYLRDPLEHALVESGFEVVETQPAFVSKVVVARRR